MVNELAQAVLCLAYPRLKASLCDGRVVEGLSQKGYLTVAEKERFQNAAEENAIRSLFRILRKKGEHLLADLVEILGGHPDLHDLHHHLLEAEEQLSEKLNINGGLALQIACVVNNQLEVNEELLYSLVDAVGGKKVYILSLNGRTRGGKSFMLSQGLKYLNAGSENGGNWIDDAALAPFVWKVSPNPVTDGIEMWSRPFIVTNGEEEVAVLLMDCQGLFDHETNPLMNAVLFTFSALLSSEFVFNDERTTEDIFTRLELFLQFAKVARNEDDQGQRLTFLVRDYPGDPRFKFGYYDDTTIPEGSTGNLKSYLFDIDTSRQGADAQEVRRSIRNFSGEIGVYAMPPPDNLPEAGVPPNEWGQDFREHVIKFVERTLNTSTILNNIKKIRGDSVTGSELKEYIRVWADVLQHTEGLPDVVSLTEATTRLQTAKLVAKCISLYEEEMRNFQQAHMDGVASAIYEQTHQTALNNSKVMFDTSRLISTERDLIWAGILASIVEHSNTNRQLNETKVWQAEQRVADERRAALEAANRARAEADSRAAAAAAENQRVLAEAARQEVARVRQGQIAAAEGEVQQASNHLEWARKNLESVRGNTAPYSYQVQVATKHKTKVFGFNGSPYYTYHTETKFNDAAYNLAVQQATSVLQEAEVRLQNANAALATARAS